MFLNTHTNIETNSLLFSDSNNVKRLEVEFQDLLRRRYRGRVEELLEAVTLGCQDFIHVCRLGLGRMLPSEDCCGKVFDPRGLYTFEGKCFSTQGVMNYTVLKYIREWTDI